MGGKAWRREEGAEGPGTEGARHQETWGLSLGEVSAPGRTRMLDKAIHVPRGMGAFKPFPGVLVSFSLDSI